MIASFFRSLEDHAVDYLLISGQATVLYGAAAFSEDIDLWVNPTEPNRRAFLSALAARRACYYKATPPFEGEADAELAAAAEKRLLARMAACQRRDREYWRDILAELRRMDRDGTLMRVGTQVQAP
ncbi:MAG: hypothetical protein JXR37_16570 [Kiritimatiellae bacterium]|nr:hypothetical protein [Kiritimatiellia bacterium]